MRKNLKVLDFKKKDKKIRLFLIAIPCENYISRKEI